MRKFFTSIILLGATLPAFSQNRFGFDFGTGVTSFTNKTSSQSFTTDTKNYAVFTGQLTYLRKISRHIYLGAKVGFEQYNFNFKKTQSDGYGGTMGTDMSQTSNYLQIGPLADVGIGRHREYLHVFMAATGGFLLSGDQTTTDYDLNWVNPNLSRTTSAPTDSNLAGATFRIQMGLKQQLPVSKTWGAVFTEAFSFMPFGTLSDNKATGNYDIHPGYFTFMVGFTHKFKDVKHLD